MLRIENPTHVPFLTMETFKQNLEWAGDRGLMRGIELVYKRSNLVPLYSVCDRMMRSFFCRITRNYTVKVDDSGKELLSLDHQRSTLRDEGYSKEYLDFYLGALKKGYFGLITGFNHYEGSCITANRDFVYVLKNELIDSILQRNIDQRLGFQSSIRNQSRLGITNIKYLNHFSRLIPPQSTNSLQNKVILLGYYYAAIINDTSTVDADVEPLLTMLVEEAMVPTVRYCMIMDLPIPPQCMHLAVSSKLTPELVGDRIYADFQNGIIDHCISVGTPIKYYDSIRDVLYNHLVYANFNKAELVAELKGLNVSTIQNYRSTDTNALDGRQTRTLTYPINVSHYGTRDARFVDDPCGIMDVGRLEAKILDAIRI